MLSLSRACLIKTISSTICRQTRIVGSFKFYSTKEPEKSKVDYKTLYHQNRRKRLQYAEQIRELKASVYVNKTVFEQIYQPLLAKSEEDLRKAKTSSAVMNDLLHALGGLRVLNEFFNEFIEQYAAAIPPDTKYTEAQVIDAYEKFLSDKNKPIAVDLMSKFPGEAAKQVAETLVKLYDRLSWCEKMARQSFLKALLKSDKSFVMDIDFIISIGTILSTKEREDLDKLIEVVHDDYYKNNQVLTDYYYETDSE